MARTIRSDSGAVKPASEKKLKKFVGGVYYASVDGLKGCEARRVALKFPVSLGVCQTNPHIDKVKTI
jgi:hypothetical protein